MPRAKQYVFPCIEVLCIQLCYLHCSVTCTVLSVFSCEDETPLGKLTGGSPVPKVLVAREVVEEEFFRKRVLQLGVALRPMPGEPQQPVAVQSVASAGDVTSHKSHVTNAQTGVMPIMLLPRQRRRRHRSRVTSHMAPCCHAQDTKCMISRVTEDRAGGLTSSPRESTSDRGLQRSAPGNEQQQDRSIHIKQWQWLHFPTHPRPAAAERKQPAYVGRQCQEACHLERFFGFLFRPSSHL